MIKPTLPPPEFPSTSTSARPPPLPPTLPIVAGSVTLPSHDHEIVVKTPSQTPHYSSASIPPMVMPVEVSTPVAPRLQPEVVLQNQPGSCTPNEPENKSNVLRYAITGVSVLGILAVLGGGGYLWKKQADAEAQNLATQVRLTEEATAREAALRTQAQKEKQVLETELAQAKSAVSASEQNNKPSAPSEPSVERAKLLISDAVPKVESDRRAAISTQLDKEDTLAESRLGAMQAQKLLVAAGISPSDAAGATVKIQQAVLSPSDARALEASLVEIETLPKPVRGDRKASRSANDEGLRMMQAGRFEDATSAFNRALSADPADAEVLGNLSYAYLKNGQLAETLRISNYAVRVSPRRAGAWNQLAFAQAQRGADWLAVRAFLVLYSLSGDQTKTRDFLNRTAAENSDERVRAAAKNALFVLPEATPR